jgi:hypothetical protein
LYGDIAGLPGLPGCGDQAGEKPAGDIPLASLDALGENPGPPENFQHINTNLISRFYQIIFFYMLFVHKKS